MAETAYDRYLKDQALKGNIEEREAGINNLDELREAIQSFVIDTTEPKKPVKWLSLPDPKNILNLYFTLSPTARLNTAIGVKKAPK